MGRFFDICNSGTDRVEWRKKPSPTFEGAQACDLSQPVTSIDDPRLGELTAMAVYMEGWYAQNQEDAHPQWTEATKSAGFFTREFYFDFRLCCRSLVGFCEYHLPFCHPGEGIAFRWINQVC